MRVSRHEVLAPRVEGQAPRVVERAPREGATQCEGQRDSCGAQTGEEVALGTVVRTRSELCGCISRRGQVVAEQGWRGKVWILDAVGRHVRELSAQQLLTVQRSGNSFKHNVATLSVSLARRRFREYLYSFHVEKPFFSFTEEHLRAVKY